MILKSEVIIIAIQNKHTLFHNVVEVNKVLKVDHRDNVLQKHFRVIVAAIGLFDLLKVHCFLIIKELKKFNNLKVYGCGKQTEVASFDNKYVKFFMIFVQI